MAFPIPGEAIIAAVSGLGGAGSGLAIFRHFATKWAEEREAADRENADGIEDLQDRLDTIRTELQTEFRTALDALRVHTDTELLRVSNKNHELSNTIGIMMNEMQNQKRSIEILTDTVKGLADKVEAGTLAVTALTGRLLGAGLLRRASDKGDDS